MSKLDAVVALTEDQILAQFNAPKNLMDCLALVKKMDPAHAGNIRLRDAVGDKVEERWAGNKANVILFWPEIQPKRQPEPDPEPKAEPEPKPPAIRAAPVNFQHSKNPTGISPSLDNALRAIDALKIDCRYDEFHDRIIVQGHECVEGSESLDNVVLKIRQIVLRCYGFDPTSAYVFDAVKMRCLDHRFNPVRDYLDGLRWDGKPRLGSWLVDYCGARDTELNREIGRKMLIAAVRRVRQPGCKFDYIVGLEGPQGVGKSTLLSKLAGEDNYSDAEIIGSDKREQQEAVQGVWIYEIAELQGLHKSDVIGIKVFASKTVDRARPAYARVREDRPRRCIFVGTTNEDTYLRDETGNRRFWPVRIGRVDLVGIDRDRDQLWAEAVEAEATGQPLVIPEHLWAAAAIVQRARMEVDPWHDLIEAQLTQFERSKSGSRRGVDGSFCCSLDDRGNSEWRVSTNYLLTTVLGMPKDRIANQHTKRLALIMRDLGWSLSETPIRIGNKTCRA